MHPEFTCFGLYSKWLFIMILQTDVSIKLGMLSLVTLDTRHNYIKFENNDGPELHSREKRSAENHHRSRRAFDPKKKECQLYMRVRLSGCNSISVFTVFSVISFPSFHAGHCRLFTVSLTICFMSRLLFLKHFQPP